MPLFCANRPFAQCTVAIATTITESISAGPIGPSNPVATSSPLAISVSAGKRRERLAGLEAELLEEATGAGEAVAAEPAEDLLGAVRRHHQPEHHPHHQQP